MLAFDTETFLITETCKAPRLVCVSYAQKSDILATGLLHVNDPDTLPTVRAWLESEYLVGHNVAYDMAVLMAQWPELTEPIFKAYDENRVTCTKIRQMLLDNAMGCFRGTYTEEGKWIKYGYSLADLGRRFLAINMEKDEWRLRYSELIDTPLDQWPEGAKKYAIDDAKYTRQICVEQDWQRIRALRALGLDNDDTEEEVLQDQYRQARAAFALQLIYCWGMRVDVSKLNILEKALVEDYEKSAKLLSEPKIGLLKPPDKHGKRVRDTKAAMDRMQKAFEALGKKPKLTDTGRISLDEDACEASEDPVLKVYAQITKDMSVLNKDVKALRCGEVHGDFQPFVATGRTSCRGYNLQNPSRKDGIRESFIPREGFVFAAVDLDGAELRGMAQVCIDLLGHSKMAEALNAKQDPHLMLGAGIEACTYEDLKALYKADDEHAKDLRQLGKIGNFGLAGGMGVARFVEHAWVQYQVRLTHERGAQVKNAWFQTWPEFHEYFKYISARHEAGWIRQLRSNRIRGGASYTETANTPFQGLIADAAKAALWQLSKACYCEKRNSILFGSRPVNFVHDEYILEVPEDIGHECAMELAGIVRTECGKFLPNVPPTGTPHLMRFWSKGAKPIYDANNRLIPWNGKVSS